ARPTPMFAESLCVTQADPLGDACEVEARTTIRHPAAFIALKEGPWSSPQKPHPLGVICVKPFDSARGNRHKTRLAVLATPYRNHSRIEIDVAIVEFQRLVDAQAGDSDQPEERRAGPPSETIARRQPGGACDDRRNLAVRVDVGS